MAETDVEDVSRETLRDLKTYVALVERWNPRINLISKASVPNLWDRHIRDSLQLAGFLPSAPAHWLDLGSGGGFPGIVIAILAKERNRDLTTILVESDARKCVFLRTVVRELNLNAKVLNDRIENIPPQNADIVSARALADLSSLLGHAKRHLKPSGMAVFPKGASWEKEIDAARSQWSFDCEMTKSQTDPNAVILSIGNIAHV